MYSFFIKDTYGEKESKAHLEDLNEFIRGAESYWFDKA
jgi:hypothetical protein